MHDLRRNSRTVLSSRSSSTTCRSRTTSSRCRRCAANHDDRAILLCAGAVCRSRAQNFTQRGFLDRRTVHVYPADRARRQRPRHRRIAAALRGLLPVHARRCAWRAPSTRAPTRTVRRSATCAPGLVGPRRCAVRPFRVRRLSVVYGHRGRSPSNWASSSSAGARPTSSTRPTASRRATSSTSWTTISWPSPPRASPSSASGNTLDAVFAPRFTPSRMPLLNQRWAVLPAGVCGMPRYSARAIPARAQFGVRWNHVGRGFEHLAVVLRGLQPPAAASSVGRRRRSASNDSTRACACIGGDAAMPLRWFTVKGEVGLLHFSHAAGRRVRAVRRAGSSGRRASGRWWAAMRASTSPGAAPCSAFSPDRGLTRAFLGARLLHHRRQPQPGVRSRRAPERRRRWFEAEYSQAFGQHWRATARLHADPGRSDRLPGPVPAELARAPGAALQLLTRACPRNYSVW